MESRKMVLTNLFTGQQQRNRQREQIDGHEERVKYMKRATWKLTLLCVKQIADGNLLYGSGNSNRGSVIKLEGWDGEGDGREVQKGGDICISMTDSC